VSALSAANRRRLAFLFKELREAELVDRAMTIAAQAFTSFIPLVVALASLAPFGSETTSQALGSLLALPDSTQHLLADALPQDPPSSAGFGVLGFLFVLVMGTSLSRALGRMYARVWRSAPAGLRGGWRWVATLLGIAVTAFTVRALHGWLDAGYLDDAVDLTSSFVANALLWTWVPWLLLCGQVPLRRLAPGGLLTGLGMALVSVGTSVYLPRSMALAADRYGSMGVAFTYISWFFVVACVLVAAAVLGRLFVGSEWSDGRLGSLAERVQ
jgi:membrane protein